MDANTVALLHKAIFILGVIALLSGSITAEVGALTHSSQAVTNVGLVIAALGTTKILLSGILAQLSSTTPAGSGSTPS